MLWDGTIRVHVSAMNLSEPLEGWLNIVTHTYEYLAKVYNSWNIKSKHDDICFIEILFIYK